MNRYIPNSGTYWAICAIRICKVPIWSYTWVGLIYMNKRKYHECNSCKTSRVHKSLLSNWLHMRKQWVTRVTTRDTGKQNKKMLTLFFDEQTFSRPLSRTSIWWSRRRTWRRCKYADSVMPAGFWCCKVRTVHKLSILYVKKLLHSIVTPNTVWYVMYSNVVKFVWPPSIDVICGRVGDINVGWLGRPSWIPDGRYSAFWYLFWPNWHQPLRTISQKNAMTQTPHRAL